MTNPILLTAIALGLWANIATSLIRPATATDNLLPYLIHIQADVESIASHVSRLAGGTCTNRKLC
jgi:hypothetical protein